MGAGEAVSRPEFAPIRCEGLRGGWSPLIDPQAAYLKIGSAWVKNPLDPGKLLSGEVARPREGSVRERTRW